jgi:hypothetical protein
MFRPAEFDRFRAVLNAVQLPSETAVTGEAA